MTENEFKNQNPHARIFTAERFFDEIRRGGEIFNDLIFVGDIPLRPENCDNIVQFNNCFFVNGFVLMNSHCRNSVFVTKCYFSNSINFGSQARFTILTFSGCNTTNLNIEDGNFGTISINECAFEHYSITGGKFDLLSVDRSSIKIQGFFIHQNELGFGDIKLSKVDVDTILIQGKITNRVIIGDVKCHHLSFYGTLVENKVRLIELTPLDKTSKVSIVDSALNTTEFFNINFSEFSIIEINNSIITDCQFIGCIWGDNFPLPKDTNAIVRQKEVYRQLKLSMSTHKDNTQEQFFYGKEMEMQFKLTKLKWKTVGDIIILFFSKYTSNFGQSLTRPIGALLLGHSILFVIALSLGAFHPLQISFDDYNAKGFELAFEKFFIFISPFRKWENSLSGYLIIIDVSMRILSAFMIYNMIRATRRFIDK